MYNVGMAEQPSEGDAAFNAAFDRFRELLKARGVEALACPICGANAWEAVTDVGLVALEGRDPATGSVENVSGSVHALAITCGECGFINLFDREVLGN